MTVTDQPQRNASYGLSHNVVLSTRQRNVFIAATKPRPWNKSTFCSANLVLSLYHVYVLLPQGNSFSFILHRNTFLIETCFCCLSMCALMFPVDTGDCRNFCLMLGQRLRRWPNIKPTLVRRLVCTEHCMWLIWYFPETNKMQLL